MNKNKIFIVLAIAVVAIGTFFFLGTQKNIISTSTQVSDTTENWKTYQFQGGLFKYPSGWNENPIQMSGSGSTIEFKDKDEQYVFTFSIRGNYSQLTGKPFATLEESESSGKTLWSVTVDGQEGRQIFPVAGSENKHGLIFFTKDRAFIYSLVLETSAKNGTELFGTILSTFKFLDNQVSQQKAIELVRNQKDVQVWLALFSGPGQTSPKTGGRPVIAFDHMDGNRYIIHVFEDLPDHTATFNWFEVDSETGAVTRTFNF